MNKNSGLSKLLRATLLLFISVYLSSCPSSRRDPKGSLPTFRTAQSQVAGDCWRTPKKKSSSRLLRKKRGTVDPRERWITKVDFPLCRKNKFVAHIPLRILRWEGISSSLYHLRRRPSSFPTRFLRCFASRISSEMIIVAKISKESQGTDPHRQNLSKLFFSLTFPPASLTILSKNQFSPAFLFFSACLILSF